MKSTIYLACVSIVITLGGCTAAEDAGSPARPTGAPSAPNTTADSAVGASAGASQAGSSAAPGSPAPDCAEAEANTPSDLSTLGAIGACAPAGIVLPCRIDSPAYTCDPSPSADASAQNRCRNVSDCAVLDAIDAQAAAKTGPRASNIVRGCGLPYITGTNSDCAAIESSATACVMTETSAVLAPGLSPECASCFTQSLLCNLKCLAHCSIDAESTSCIACMHVEGCRGLFYQCSGLEPVD